MSTPVVLSWSGGKDSAFALWALADDPRYDVVALLTTLTEGYERVSMHGVREELLDAQADAVGLPVVKVRIPPACVNDVYDARMAGALASERLAAVEQVAFADLYLADIRAYREERLARAGKVGLFPLWGRDTGRLAREMIASGFRATLVCVDPRVLDASFAGRAYDESLLEDLPEGVDPCGENGEFHTFVWDAPVFARPIRVERGETVTRDDFVFADLLPAAAVTRTGTP